MTQNDLMSELKQQALVDINEARDAQALQEVSKIFRVLLAA